MTHNTHRLRCAAAMLIGLVVWALPAERAAADLVLTIDTAAQTYRLTGSDSTTPFPGDDSDFSQWINSIGGISTLTSFTHTIATANPDPLTLTQLRLYEGYVDIVLDWGASGVGPQSFSGNGIAYSYAAASPAQKAYFEGLIGDTLEPAFAHNLEPIPVVGVPEPASAMLLAVGAVALLRRRRRGRAVR